jgi:hypothetical protein
MNKDTALRLALEALEREEYRLRQTGQSQVYSGIGFAITAIKAALANEALERKAENARELGLDYEPYGFEASIYSNARMKVDVVTGNVSIGTVKKPCGLECDCTDVCKQDDYKVLWQQMCERCDELDKKLAQLEAKDEPVGFMHAGQVLEMQQGRLPCGYVYPKRAPGASVALYRTPPQRKPLTDEEIWKFWWNKPEVPEGEDDSMEAQFVAACRRAIEAAHGIKGEA